MIWHQLVIRKVQEAHVPFIRQLGTLLGAECISIIGSEESPQFDTLDGAQYLWPTQGIQFLLAKPLPVALILSLCASNNIVLAPDQVCLETLTQTDWESQWRHHFQTMHFGDLTIAPPWEAKADRQSDPMLILNPGRAFGTGQHTTTAMCLHWLAAQDLKGKCVVDYGCGSGILALSASALGAQQVYATDIDEDAMACTRENMRDNPHTHIEIFKAETLPNNCADILLANILLQPLITLCDKFNHIVKINGIMVLTGIMEDQKDILFDIYESHLDIISTQDESGWSLIVGKAAGKDKKKKSLLA